MKPIDRVRCSLAHNEPDRVPRDFWATPEFQSRLCESLRLGSEEDMLRHLGIDLRYYRGPSYTGAPFGQPSDGVAEDLWGVLRKKMTVEGGSYNWTYSHVVSSPLETADSVRDIDEYGHWPSADWWDYGSVAGDCGQFDGYAVVYAGDRLDRTAQLKPAMYLRGMEQIYIDLHENPAIADAVIAHIKECFLAYNQRLFEAANGKIDIFMMGDDFGTQNSLMMGVDTWRRHFKQGFRQYIELAHRYGMKVMHHSCGAVRELIPDFIDCGLDILQSVQPRAVGMDLGELKREFGKDLSFHGSIDIQDTLPHGTVDDVRAEVKQRMVAGKPGGGFIISTAHNIQPDTPVENVIVLFDAYREFGSYE